MGLMLYCLIADNLSDNLSADRFGRVASNLQLLFVLSWHLLNAETATQGKRLEWTVLANC